MRNIKKKKGFTLVELLAVIAILALLVIIVLPNVLRMYRNARKDSFVTEAKTLFKTVTKQNFLTYNKPRIFNTGDLDISGGPDLEYSVSTDQLGQVLCFQVANTDFMWIYRNNGQPLTDEESIANEDEITERDHDIIIDCSGAQMFDTTIPATLGTGESWWEGDYDKTQIERIIFTYSKTEDNYDQTFYSDAEKVGGLTTYIKGKIAYIVINRNKRKSKSIVMPEDSSNTFAGFTNLKNIQGLKLLDFSGVKKMDNFFGRYSNGEVISGLTSINGYDTFNTSNVTSAKYAFAGVKLSAIDLSNWNVGKLMDATGMFYKSGATLINLSGWNLQSLVHYTDMFAGSNKLESINLNGWNTNPNANYGGMFNDCTNLVSVSTGSGFKVNKTDTVMFKNDSRITGGHDTTFINDKSLYARVDGGESSPGYFSSNNSDGVVSAKLYDSGTVSGSYTDLTNTGAVPSDWDYYVGARLLEVKVYSMKTGSQKTLEISVPAGMYIVNNSWTKSGGGISSVNFTKLANQGTGSYSNANTGTLKYTFGSSATSGSVQMLVMFDRAIWDKNKKNASAFGTDNMTLTAPIVVNYNNGSVIRKISNIHSAVSIGKASNGMGYSFYTYDYNSNIYIDDATTLLASNSLLSSDQSGNPYFFKKVTYETYATFKDTSGKVKYATIEQGVVPSNLGTNVSNDSNETYYAGEWNNVYSSSGLAFPRPKYKVKSEDNPKLGTNLTVYIKAKVTSLSGQTRSLSATKNYIIKSKDLDLTDFIISSGEKASPSESYYGNSGYSGILGVFTMYNKGYEDINNVKVVFEYDTGTAKNQPPGMKVLAARPFLQNGQEVNAKITLVSDTGAEVEVPSFKIKSTSNTNGAYVSHAAVAASVGLGSNYYLKKIEYTIPVVSGFDKKTGQINYLYHSQGSHSQSSGGNFIGVVSKQSTSKCSVYYNNNLVKTVTSTSKVTNTPGFSGFINRINTPLGTEFTAGDDIELAINVSSCSYPYTNTQAFSKPEVYLVLPFGINVDSVLIGNSAAISTSETPPVVTKVKTMSVGDVLSNVYKITTRDNIWFGYLNATSTGATSGQYASKWFRVKLTTDLSMEYTSINLRDSVYFKDASGHISISGSYAQYSISDQFDVDNDGSTSDRYGTTNNANQIINIYEASEDE